jgi:hypothetical protein
VGSGPRRRADDGRLSVGGADLQPPKGRYRSAPVQITFVDALGAKWRRRPDGTLEQWREAVKPPPAGPTLRSIDVYEVNAEAHDHGSDDDHGDRGSQGSDRKYED